MLAEIAAANAAFSVIKKAIQNTGDITKAGKAIGEFVFAKDMLKKTGERKKNSIWSKALGREASELEEFMALEDLKQKEDELRSMMQIYGRGGLWNDYIKFQAEARKNREYQRKEREKFIEYVKEIVLATIILVGSIGMLVGIVWLLMTKQAN